MQPSAHHTVIGLRTLSSNSFAVGMRSLLGCITLALLVTGCGTPKVASEGPSVGAGAVSIQEAFNEAGPLARIAGRDIVVAPGRTPVVKIDGTELLVVPVVLDGSGPNTLKISSRVARTESGAYVLFYPVISFLDQEFQVYRTLKPKCEFAFSKNVLTNEFDVPAGVERLLIRTDREFLDGAFTGLTSMSTPPPSAPFAMMGALGGLAYALVLSGHADGSTAHDFKLAPVGVIRLDAVAR
jgi:hypothetical protein